MGPIGRRSLAGPLALLLAAPLPAQTAAAYRPVLDQVRAMAPRPDQVAAVHDLTIRRDSMEFHLADGQLVLATPVDGRTIAAVFVGTGSVRFAPALAVERRELTRVLGDSAESWPISAIAFVFADSTAAELERRLTFAADPGVAATAQAPLHDALSRLVDPHSKTVVFSTLMSALLNRVASGFFYAQVRRREGEDLMLLLDPRQSEEVALLRKGRFEGQSLQLVSQFPAAPMGQDSIVVDDGRHEPLALGRYRIEATIRKNLDLAARVTVTVTARQDSIQWIPLELYHELDVDSVGEGASGSGADDYYRAAAGSALWVRVATPLHSGESRELHVSYHGKVIGNGSLMLQFLREIDAPRSLLPPGFDRWFFVKTTSTWFPRYGSGQPTDVDLTFHVPHQYRLASIGRLVDSSEEGEVRTTHWVTERPADQVCFNLGEFDEIQIADPRIPPVTVQTNTEAHRQLDQILLARPDPQSVLADVTNSLAFFTQRFGTPLYARYYVTEIPFAYGQAFPGLMYLSVGTYQTLDESGSEELFRAHEMAHQWWGIGVEPAGVRDAWLAEGFADFAGLWYMQMILHDNDKFFKQVRDRRTAIRARRHDAPPIALGYRIGQTDHPADYSLIVYEKGAWVLQMLRNLMLNLHTMSEDAFIATLQDFYQQYRGRRASTQDFQRVVEQHMGQPMRWFFDEWVYGTDIPTYVLSWRTEKAATGQTVLHVRVRQEDVPDSFVMPVPLRIVFGDGREAYVRINVRGGVTEGSIPLPGEPTLLELNPLESVLAEVKTEGWH